MAYNINSKWYIDVPPSEVDALKLELINNKKTLDKLHKIVYNMCMKEDEVRISDYDTPNWSHKEAHRRGRQDALREICKIVNIGEPDV